MVSLPQDGLVLNRYADVAAVLMDPKFTRSIDVDRFERNSILEDVLMMLSGNIHRDRRRVENALFRRETLEFYERELFPKVIDQTLDVLLDQGRADLLNIGALLTVALSARTAGVDLDEGSLEARWDLVRLLRVFARGVAIDASTDPEEDVKSEVRDALEAFDERHYRASLNRREEAVAAHLAGNLQESELDRDILTTLLLNRDRLPLTESQLRNETAFFLEAGSHTSSQSLASSFHHVVTWIAEDPSRISAVEDPAVVQRCVHEALRLRPTNPLIRRRAAALATVQGTTVPEGSLVYLNTYRANRDEAVFGPTAEQFDPDRSVPGTAARYGHSFGGGIHACIGRALAIGYPIRGNAQGPDHLVGLVTIMVMALLRRGVRPDPDTEPTLDDHTTRWTRWSGYPVIVAEATSGLART